MKKLLLTIVMMIGIVSGLFAQQLTYQAVVRDNNQQLVVNTSVRTYITINFTTGDPYLDTVDATTNLHGLLTFEFGDETLEGRNWKDATLTTTVVNRANTGVVYVNNLTRPVSAVPYALSVNGQSIQNYLTANNYVTTATLDGRHYLTSDSAVITTMQSEITALQGTDHTHANKAVLDRTEKAYTATDSTKLAGIAEGAEVNVQSDWTQDTITADDYIKNKPTLATVATSGSYSDLTNTPTIPTTVAELTDATDYAKKDGNTYTGSHDFTGGTTTVASGFTFATTSSTCGNVAVNACDLLTVFDSIQRTIAGLRDEISDLRDTLQRLRGATAPRFNDMSIVPTDSSLQVTADFSDGGANITEYNFCISASSDMGSPTCDTSTTNSHTFTGLNPGTTYYVTVAANNLKGTTTSSVQSAETSYAAPELGEPVTATPESNTEISVQGSLENMGGAPSVSVKVCAYTTPDYSDTPICGSDSVITSAPKDYKVSVSGLTKNTRYYLAVIADNGQKRDTVLAEATTWNITISISSNRADTIFRCGSLDTTVTYTANVTGITSPTYAWKVNGSDSTAVTGSTLTVRYTGTATSRVVCTVHGVSDTAVTVTKVGVVPTLGLCEDCNAGTITVKTKTNVASIVWRNSSSDSVSNSTTSLVQSATIPAGVYTATAQSSDGCSVSRTATLGNATSHPCTVTSLKAGTNIAGGKYANKEYGTGTQLDSVSDHEGNVYRVVQIGEGANAQCWLAENMRATTSPSTHSIIVFGNASAYVSSYSSKCAINHNDSKYGVLYNWCAAVDTFYANGGKPELANASGHSSSEWSITMPAGNRRGICPEGWHIPTDAEWTSMASLAGVGQDSGTGVSKLSGGCDWSSKSDGTYPGSYSDPDRNSTGFSALSAGYCGGSSISNVGNGAYFWSATPNSSSNAWSKSFGYGGQYVYRDYDSRTGGFSVRCLRDNTGVTMGAVTKTDSTTRTLVISAEYTATKAVTGATVCAYMDAACANPAGSCATGVAYSTSPITGTVTGLTPDSQYYVKVTVTTEGGTESAIAGPFKTKEVTMSITSDPASATVGLCGASSVQVTYTATVDGETPSSYTWSVSGGTATASTTSTYTVSYTAAGSYTVSCTANGAGVNASKSVTITSGGTAATLGLCEDCNAGSITMKSGNCTSLTWVNDADPTKTGTVSSVTTGSVVLSVSSSVPAGVYSFTGTNSDGCSVSRTATLGNATSHPCTVTAKRGNEAGTTTRVDSVKDHQANWYKVIQIGDQCWLKENMRCTTSPKGNLTAGDSNVSPFVAYYYDYTAATQFSLRERGYLYNWAGAIDTNGTSNITASFTGRRGICPEGWHIPTDDEWKTLEGGYLTGTDGTTAITSSTLNNTGYRGKGAGKFTGGCDWLTNGSGEQTFPGNYSYSDCNTTGFSALPAGSCNGSSFNSAGSYAYFWSATSYSGKSAWYRRFLYNREGVSRDSENKGIGRSVRCLRD